jgi:hypothetical protein
MNTNIAAEMGALTLVTMRTLIKVPSEHDSPDLLTRVAISTMTYANGMVTVVTASAHYMVAGETVTISGADQSQYNGTFGIEAVASATQFTFRLPGPAPVTPSTGAGRVMTGDIYFRKAVCYGRKAVRTNNAGTVWLGTQALDGEQPMDIAVNGQIIIQPATGCRMNLKDFYVDPEDPNTGDGVLVLFH